MATDVEICNEALAYIKHSKLIQSLNESGSAASYCNLFFDKTRNLLLSKYAWLFAQTQDYMALYGTPPLGWSYQYALPDNCVRPLYIKNSDSDDPKDKIPFERRLSDDKTTQVIVTNKEQANLVYTYKISNISAYPDYFTNALSFLLAIKLASPLSKKDNILRNVTAQFDHAFMEAKNLDAISFHKKVNETASHHDVRMV